MRKFLGQSKRLESVWSFHTIPTEEWPNMAWLEMHQRQVYKQQRHYQKTRSELETETRMQIKNARATKQTFGAHQCTRLRCLERTRGQFQTPVSGGFDQVATEMGQPKP
eukprot:GHVT01033281.1.p1 GENE.GHVT01033281.1~~GHVT01033281.1.p1  ORF type:complete len:109 (+),score=13.37 GHVT01033281.1:485-811(+)